MRSRTATSKGVCPHCGEPLKRVPIMFGYPLPETFEAAARGEVVLGGCIVSDDDPAYACAACHEPVPAARKSARPADSRVSIIDAS